MGYKYWLIKLYGWHVVRAESGEEALDIAKRHDLGRNVIYRHAKPVSETLIRREHRLGKTDSTEFGRLDDNEFGRFTLNRRKQGKGGKVFYEDENGNLRTENDDDETHSDKDNE